MEEDIMILESECYYLEELGYLKENNHFIRFNQALKNLIKGYRELEEKNKQCIKAGDLERAVGFLMNRNDLSNYVPKSKIREKIEEIKNGIKNDMRNCNKVKDANWKLAIQRSMAQKIETKKVLQELLEEEV